MKETVNFLKNREEHRNIYIRNQTFGIVRQYVENRKNLLKQKNKKAESSEEMRNLLKSHLLIPKGKPLVYLEGISNGRKVVNRVGQEQQQNTLHIAINSAKEVLKRTKEARRMVEIDNKLNKDKSNSNIVLKSKNSLFKPSKKSNYYIKKTKKSNSVKSKKDCISQNTVTRTQKSNQYKVSNKSKKIVKARKKMGRPKTDKNLISKTRATGKFQPKYKKVDVKRSRSQSTTTFRKKKLGRPQKNDF